MGATGAGVLGMLALNGLPMPYHPVNHQGMTPATTPGANMKKTVLPIAAPVFLTWSSWQVPPVT